MSKVHRRPDGRTGAQVDPSRPVAHLFLDAAGNVATEFVTERVLDGRARPSRAAVESLFGSWGHLDAETLLDDLQCSRDEVAPTPVFDEE